MAFDAFIDLREKAKNGLLSHGYIFFGDDSGALLDFASALAVSLETGEDKPAKDKNIPDKILIDALFIRKGGEASIGIDKIREIKKFLSSRPALSRRRTVIIEEGDALTHQAQNALLKITEDAPEHALVIIIARREENLLPTLLSRLQRIYRAKADGASGASYEGKDMAGKLAAQFLKSSREERAEIIKTVVGKEDKNAPDITGSFLNGLLGELKKDLIGNSKFIGAVLERQRLLGQHPLNKRLQLEFLSSLWYNRLK